MAARSASVLPGGREDLLNSRVLPLAVFVDVRGRRTESDLPRPYLSRRSEFPQGVLTARWLRKRQRTIDDDIGVRSGQSRWLLNAHLSGMPSSPGGVNPSRSRPDAAATRAGQHKEQISDRLGCKARDRGAADMLDGQHGNAGRRHRAGVQPTQLLESLRPGRVVLNHRNHSG